MSRASEDPAGFTLLEVLVAVLIASMALPVVFRGAAEGLLMSNSAERSEQAVSRALSHLAAVADTGSLHAQNEQGDDGSGFRWQVEVAEVGASAAGFAPPPDDAEPPDPGAQDAKPMRASLFNLTVTESWRSGPRMRSVRLVSQRMQPVSDR
jgi:general secretion pathway protein I